MPIQTKHWSDAEHKLLKHVVNRHILMEAQLVLMLLGNFLSSLVHGVLVGGEVQTGAKKQHHIVLQL